MRMDSFYLDVCWFLSDELLFALLVSVELPRVYRTTELDRLSRRIPCFDFYFLNKAVTILSLEDGFSVKEEIVKYIMNPFKFAACIKGEIKFEGHKFAERSEG